jgi:abhydrolase domain-containing protein 12
MAISTVQTLLCYVLLAIAILTAIYFGTLGLIVAVPSLQTHALYLHRVRLIWFKDINIPEVFGFLHNQVTPFPIETSDGETLHAWHVLPLTLYRRHEKELLAQPSGFAHDLSSRLSFKLLRDAPDARLVIYLHGTAGCMASGVRPDVYRALYSAAPDKIHIVTIDYRGYGLSSGTPSEEGLLLDAIALAAWAVNVAGIPTSRTVLFAQSLGTAVAISLMDKLRDQSSTLSFAGTILVAPFSDVSTLTATYRIGGFIPVLSPLGLFPPLLAFFNGFLESTWRSKDRIASFVKRSESEGSISNYHITLIHAQDDTTIPYIHTEVLFWHAVNATVPTGISYKELERKKAMKRIDVGAGGWAVEWSTKKGLIREELLKYGSHDKVGAYPSIAMAVFRAFQNTDPAFGG